LFVGTWNMNELKSVGSRIADFLLPASLTELPDCYAIGTQENTMSKEEWEIIMQEVIGLTHVLLHSVTLGTLHLAIFLRRELIWFCSECEESTIATRQGSAIKTKGAVAVALQIFGTSFLFINSHLAAHEGNLRERISDYEKIREGLEFSKNKPISDITASFDNAFWFGDLNFRISNSRLEVLKTLNDPAPNLDILLQADQLITVLKNGDAFSNFHESAISFIPTFKYNIGTDCFDTSEKQRTPAYTDRILCRTKKKDTVSWVFYDSATTIQLSDHKPVFALFQCQLRPGRDNIPLAAGLFNRNVYLKALSRRAAYLDPSISHKISKVCTVM